jgi:hypothetical protein
MFRLGMRKWRKRLRIMLGLLLLLLSLLTVFVIFEHFRGRVALARYKSALIARGEKLSPAELASTATDSENGVPELYAAIAELGNGAILQERCPPRMKTTPEGRAIACFREDFWIADKITNDWGQVSDELETNKATLDRILTALAKPALDNKVDLALADTIDYTHLSHVKALTHWFGPACQLELRHDQTHTATDYLVAEIGLPRALAGDRLTISELVRIAIGAAAYKDTWEAMQADDWSDADLERIQHAWADQDFIDGLVRGLEGEMVFGISMCEKFRHSNEKAARSLFFSFEDLLRGDEAEKPLWERILSAFPGGDSITAFLKKQVYCRIWRFAWLDQYEARNLKSVEGLLKIGRSAAKEKSLATANSSITQAFLSSESTGIYNKLRFPNDDSAAALSRTVARAMRAETERSLAICAVALKRYALRRAALPTSLGLLAPEFVPLVPIDYMDGRPLRYRRNAENTYTLYSVGEDGKDDGVDTALSPGKSGKNLWDRKDFVWPAPALPDEIEAYHRDAAKN